MVVKKAAPAKARRAHSGERRRKPQTSFTSTPAYWAAVRAKCEAEYSQFADAPLADTRAWVREILLRDPETQARADRDAEATNILRELLDVARRAVSYAKAPATELPGPAERGLRDATGTWLAPLLRDREWSSHLGWKAPIGRVALVHEAQLRGLSDLNMRQLACLSLIGGSQPKINISDNPSIENAIQGEMNALRIAFHDQKKNQLSIAGNKAETRMPQRRGLPTKSKT